MYNVTKQELYNMRKTKVICTIGPASENEEILTKMMEAGMNVARLIFSPPSARA